MCYVNGQYADDQRDGQQQVKQLFLNQNMKQIVELNRVKFVVIKINVSDLLIENVQVVAVQYFCAVKQIEVMQNNDQDHED